MTRETKNRQKHLCQKFSTVKNCDVIVIFPIYGQFGAIQKPDSERIACKTYTFNNSNLLSCKNWKQLKNLQHSSHTINLSRSYFYQKMLIFCKKKKNADISKIKRALVLKNIFSEITYVCVRTHQISSF